jgi:aminoglycoside phosphotransferase
MEKPTRPLPEPLHDWCVSVLGPGFLVVSDHAQAHGLSGVWRLHTAAGEPVYLKAATRAVKWEQEVYAYGRWVTPAFGDRSPRLLAASADGPRALLVSALPGECMEQVAQDPVKILESWRKAGEHLARLHNLEKGRWIGGVRPDGSPTGETWNDPVEYVSWRIEDAVLRGLRDGTLRADEAEFVRAVAPEWSAALSGEPPVPTHRDYTPRNWIADPVTGDWVGVIDFEHAGWNLRVMDLCRPWSREFVGRPDLAAALFEGYAGGPPDGRLRAQVAAARLWHCVASIVWAAGIGDAAFVEESRAGLDRLRTEPIWD